MVGEQAAVGTNMYIDMIMGSKDLQEMMRTMEGLQRITESDEEQIESLNKEKEALNQQKSEQKRLIHAEGSAFNPLTACSDGM